MPAEDLTSLSLERLNELMVEMGESVTLLSSSFLELNASDEAQYEVTHFSAVTGGNVQNHVFVDLDLQGDVELVFNDIEDGDMWLRRTEEEIAAEQAAGNPTE